MIIFFIIILFLIISLYGYSYLFKYLLNTKIQFNSKNYLIEDKDLIYGIFFLVSLLLFLHFFFPIKYFVFLVPLGFLFFLHAIYKNKFKINHILIKLILLFFLLFIGASNGPTYDTQLYHHQILNWNYEYKISINLAILDDRFGMISPWQLFISLGNFKILGSYFANLFNFIPIFLIIIYFFDELKKPRNISSYFLILCTIYIFFFSLIHPFANGTILMNLGSLGTDVAGMSFYILSFFYFIKYLEKNDLEFYNLNLIFVTLAIFCRISYIPLIILPLFLIFYKNKLLINKFNIFISLVFSFWFIRSLINNGCLIFPAKNTCINFNSFLEIESIEKYAHIVKSFARTAPNYDNFMNLEYSIYSYNWFLPWFNNYFLKTSLTQIFLLLFIIFIIPFLIKLYKDGIKLLKIKLIIIFTFFLGVILWLQAPDVRFALGFLITIPAFLIIYSLNKSFLEKITNYSKNIIVVIFIFLVLKNNQNFKYLDDKNYLVRNYNYEKFKIYQEFPDFKIVKNENQGGFCFDVKDICKINDNSNIVIEKNYFNYLFFKINN